jgi:hypothetical protein
MNRGIFYIDIGYDKEFKYTNTMWVLLIISLYLLIGILMAPWDYRNIILNNHDSDLSSSSTFLEKPTFLDNLSISSALAFITIWPIKIHSQRQAIWHNQNR